MEGYFNSIRRKTIPTNHPLPPKKKKTKALYTRNHCKFSFYRWTDDMIHEKRGEDRKGERGRETVAS